MLHSYQAQLNGSQLIWIDPPPPASRGQRVVVVVEETNADSTNSVPSNRLASFARARGCLSRGRSVSAGQALSDLAALRGDWSRGTTDGSSNGAQGN